MNQPRPIAKPQGPAPQPLNIWSEVRLFLRGEGREPIRFQQATLGFLPFPSDVLLEIRETTGDRPVHYFHAADCESIETVPSFVARN